MLQTTVYKLLAFYPNDEKASVFRFELPIKDSKGTYDIKDPREDIVKLKGFINMDEEIYNINWRVK